MRSSELFHQLYLKYFSFSGRLNRKPYILRSMAATFLPVTLAIVLFYVFAGGFKTGLDYLHRDLLWLHVVLHSLLIILAIVVGFSLGVRRCHDLDKSGWWLLLGIMPYINIAWGLYMICRRGTVGPNRYGNDPVCDDFDKIEDIAEDLREQRENKKYREKD